LLHSFVILTRSARTSIFFTPQPSWAERFSPNALRYTAWPPCTFEFFETATLLVVKAPDSCRDVMFAQTCGFVSASLLHWSQRNSQDLLQISTAISRSAANVAFPLPEEPSDCFETSQASPPPEGKRIWSSPCKLPKVWTKPVDLEGLMRTSSRASESSLPVAGSQASSRSSKSCLTSSAPPELPRPPALRLSYQE
jgi:hypothetical protein